MAGEEGRNIYKILPSATEEERQKENQPAVQSERNLLQSNKAKSSRKRKFKEVATIASEAPVMAPPAGLTLGLLLPAPVSLFPRMHGLPPPLGFGIRQPNPTSDRLSTMERPATSGKEQDYYPAYVREHIDNIEKIIATQAEMLLRATKDVLRRQYVLVGSEVEQKIAPILNAREVELNDLKFKHEEVVRKEFELQNENQALQQRVTFLEETVAELTAQLQEVTERWEEAESVARCSAVNGGEEEPVLHPCKVCGRVADMVLLPCYHLCACRNCADGMNVCPICGAIPTGTTAWTL